jgi:sterol carrier protein 2
MRMMEDTRGITTSPPNAQYFANAGKEYMEKHGAEAKDFAEIGMCCFI